MKTPWETEKQWRKYGFKSGYDERSSGSLRKSEDKKERSWVNKGCDEGWEFPFEREIRQKGYLTNWDNYKEAFNKATEKNHGEQPSVSRLYEMGESSLVNCAKHYGGLTAVREKMGYKSLKKENGCYNSWHNAEKELKKAIEKNHGEFPTTTRLRELGYSTLGSIISKYHGGYCAVRIKMGYGLVKKPNGYYKNWENFEREINEAIKENEGEFPTQMGIRKLGYSSLGEWIKYYGGLLAVREKIGYNEKKRIKLAKQLEDILGELS